MCVVWGLTYQWVSTGATWAPILFTALRYSLAGLTLLIASGPRQWAVVVRTGCFWRLAIAGWLMFVTGNGIVVWALQSSRTLQPDPGLVAVAIAMIPVYTSVLSALKARDRRCHPTTWAGLALGLAGVALLSSNLGNSPGATPLSLPQVPLLPPTSIVVVMLALQCGCISWAAGSLFASGTHPDVPPLVVAGTQMFAAGVVLSLFALLHGDVWIAPSPGRDVIAALLNVTIVGSVFGYFCYALALRQLPVHIVSLHAYLNPMVAMGVAAAIGGHAYGATEVGATVLILAGVALALRAEALRAGALGSGHKRVPAR